jgi:Family of unknown function (DUF5677)
MKSNELVQALELARRVELTANSAFDRDGFQTSAQVDQLLITMVVRCLPLFQGVVRCANDDLADAAMVVARAVLEQLFVILAIARAPNEAEKSRRVALLEQQAEHDRKKALEKLRRLPLHERGVGVTDQRIAEEEADLGPLCNTPTEQWARFAGLHSLYLSAYASLSFHVHPSQLTLDSMIRRDPSGEAVLSAKPHQDALPRTVLLACAAVSHALSALPDGFVSLTELSANDANLKECEILGVEVPEIDMNT